VCNASLPARLHRASVNLWPPWLYIDCMTMLHSAKRALTSLTGLLALGSLSAEPLNVVFLTLDDFRPELPIYGATHMQTPAMDQLSQESITFRRAYVQQAVCQPSRASVLTGARPDSTQIYDVFGGASPTFRDTMGNIDTLPGTFKNNGYWTAGYGKNFHHMDAASWNVSNSFYNNTDLYQTDANRAVASNVNLRPAWEAYPNDREGNSMDAQVADATVAAIAARAQDGQPFFIAAGFWKPHLPFSAPQKYWDLYDRNSLPIAQGAQALPIQGALDPAFYDPFSGELTTYKGGRPSFVGRTAATQAALDNGTFSTNQQTGADYGIITVDGTHIYPEDYARALTHGYYACTSFIDAQIGRILEALEDPNDDGDSSDSLRDRTIILLWGDHGMHVGQHGSWPKHTNLDVATRIPLILHAPSMPESSKGKLLTALVEGVDIMPTLLELANVDAPTTHDLEGVSMAPLLSDPDQAWKTAAFSQYPRQVSGTWYMGYVMHSARFSYIQWRPMQSSDGNSISMAQRNFSISNQSAYEELYDLEQDPGQTQNLATDPHYRSLMDALGVKLQEALANGYDNTQNVASSTPAPPSVQALAMFGGSDVGDTLQAHYLFGDANGDQEQGSSLEWLRSNSLEGPYSSVVGTGSSYTLQAGDQGQFIKLRITPQSDAVPSTADPVLTEDAVQVGSGFVSTPSGPLAESAVYEGFVYDAGNLNSANNSGRGWAGGWYGNADLSFGGNSGSEVVDTAFTTLPSGYHQVPQGRAAGNRAHGNNPYRGWTAANHIDLNTDGEVFFSQLYRQDGSNAKYELRFHAGSTEITKVQISADGGLDLITVGNDLFDAATLQDNRDYVLLGRIQHSASAQDRLQLSVFTAGSNIPDSVPVFAAEVSFDSDATLDRMFMGIPFNDANTGHAFWDEFHLDRSYTAVVGQETVSNTDPPTLYEGFDYDAGGLNSSNNGGYGWEGGWYGNRDLTWGGNSGSAVVDKAWSLPSGFGYPAQGRSGSEGTNGNTPYRKLSATNQIDLSNATLYFSFLFRYDGSAGKFEFGLDTAAGEQFKLQIKNTGQLGLSGSSFQEPGFSFATNTDYLLVGKITGNASGPDLFEVSVFPAGNSLPSGEPAFQFSSSLESSAVIDRIKFGIPFASFDGGAFWDELRMGPSWSSVTAQAPQLETIRILPLGDSITYGLSFGQANGQTAFPYGYRGALQNLLQQRMDFVNRFDFIGSQDSSNAVPAFDKAQATTSSTRYDGNHQGHSSYTTARTFGSAPGNLLEVITSNYNAVSFNPHIVLLHVGINDLVANNATAAELQADYRALIEKIYEFEPGVELYVSTLMCNLPNHAAFPHLQSFNTWLSTTEVPYWQGQGRSITLVDMYAALEDNGYNGSLPSTNINYGSVEAPNDRVHPNATGYANMAAAWNTALRLPSAVNSRTLNYALWADAVYAQQAGGADHPTADPEQAAGSSGFSNLELYIYGGSSLTQELPTPPRIEVLNGKATLIYERVKHASYSLRIEHSSNLMADDWGAGSLDPEEVSDLPNGRRERVHRSASQPLANQPQHFFSVELEIP